jgi:ABC-type branched-subunit amino acid transport system substrate-binding protein
MQKPCTAQSASVDQENEMSHLTRHRLIQTTGIASAALLLPLRVGAQAKKSLKIGVMTDMSGPYAVATGLGDVLATRFAIQDFVKRHPDIGVEMVSADMLLKPDVGASIARTWYDQEGVDAIFDIPQSAVALAVGSIAKEKDKLVIFTSAGVADPGISSSSCTQSPPIKRSGLSGRAAVHWSNPGFGTHSSFRARKRAGNRYRFGVRRQTGIARSVAMRQSP